MSVVGILQDETDPMVSVMKVRGQGLGLWGSSANAPLSGLVSGWPGLVLKLPRVGLWSYRDGVVQQLMQGQDVCSSRMQQAQQHAQPPLCCSSTQRLEPGLCQGQSANVVRMIAAHIKPLMHAHCHCKQLKSWCAALCYAG